MTRRRALSVLTLVAVAIAAVFGYIQFHPHHKVPRFQPGLRLSAQQDVLPGRPGLLDCDSGSCVPVVQSDRRGATLISWVQHSPLSHGLGGSVLELAKVDHGRGCGEGTTGGCLRWKRRVARNPIQSDALVLSDGSTLLAWTEVIPEADGTASYRVRSRLVGSDGSLQPVQTLTSVGPYVFGPYVRALAGDRAIMVWSTQVSADRTGRSWATSTAYFRAGRWRDVKKLNPAPLHSLSPGSHQIACNLRGECLVTWAYDPLPVLPCREATCDPAKQAAHPVSLMQSLRDRKGHWSKPLVILEKAGSSGLEWLFSVHVDARGEKFLVYTPFRNPHPFSRGPAQKLSLKLLRTRHGAWQAPEPLGPTTGFQQASFVNYRGQLLVAWASEHTHRIYLRAIGSQLTDGPRCGRPGVICLTSHKLTESPQLVLGGSDVYVVTVSVEDGSVETFQIRGDGHRVVSSYRLLRANGTNGGNSTFLSPRPATYSDGRLRVAVLVATRYAREQRAGTRPFVLGRRLFLKSLTPVDLAQRHKR